MKDAHQSPHPPKSPPYGEIWMTNQDLFGFPNSIMRLTDVDSDGKYNSVGETHIWTDEFVDKARAMDVYGSD